MKWKTVLSLRREYTEKKVDHVNLNRARYIHNIGSMYIEKKMYIFRQIRRKKYPIYITVITISVPLHIRKCMNNV